MSHPLREVIWDCRLHANGTSDAAISCSAGKTNVTMVVSIASNVVNVVGNYLGIFVLPFEFAC